MQPSTLTLAVSALAIPAIAADTPWPNATATISYTTSVVASLTTFCPSATQFSYGGILYNVTEPTTLTITNCPCTVNVPVYTSTTNICNTCSVANVTSITTPISMSTMPAPNITNATTSATSSMSLVSSSLLHANTSTATIITTALVTTQTASTTVAPSNSTAITTSAAVSSFTGAANLVVPGAGVRIAGLMAAAAYFL